MLRRFSVEGYKSFREEAVLDLSKVRDYRFGSDCVRDGTISKAILMGANGSGKTNLGYALFDIVYTLTDNAPDPSQTEPLSFINGDGSADCATFRYEFKFGETRVRYEYSKTEPLKIASERMCIDDEVAFERTSADSVTYDPAKIGTETLQNRIGESLSFLRYVANNTVQPEDSPISLVMGYVRRMLYFRSTQDGGVFIGLARSMDDLDDFIIRNGLIDDFSKFLCEKAGLSMRLGAVSAGGMREIFVQETKKKKIPFRTVASSGTKALQLYYYWSKRFDEASLLFIDEFDACYHFELAERILGDLMGHAGPQAIMTSHNASLVGNEAMRPDCCLLIKNGKIASFSESTHRELRYGHDLKKMLRNGEFE